MGLERDAGRKVMCPECGLRQEPRIAERPGLGKFMLGCTLPTIACCLCCAPCLMLGWEPALELLVLCAAVMGVGAPILATAFAAADRERRVRRAWPFVLAFGWGLNLCIGVMFVSLALSLS